MSNTNTPDPPLDLTGDELVDEHELFFHFVELLAADQLVPDAVIGRVVRGWIAERREKN